MEVQFAPLASFQTQTGQPANPPAGADSAAVKTVQSNPSNVVTATAKSEGSRNARRDDTSGRAAQEVASSARQAVDSLRLTNRRTQIGFNSELNRVFLEVINAKTDEVVERIPSEQLVRFVAEQLATPEPVEIGPNGAVLDQSV